MFVAGAIFGALACFARADYNLPLYAFLYIMWDQDDVSYSYRLENWVERQNQTDASAGVDFHRRLAVDVLLGSLLVVQRDGQVATGSAQLRDSVLFRQLRAEADRDGHPRDGEAGRLEERGGQVLQQVIIV